MKQVPATDTRIRIAASGKAIDLTDVTMVINPYDEYAIEEALKIKEKLGGEVVVITVGPEKAAEALRTCLAIGADKAVHVVVSEPLGPDPLRTASVLAQVLKGELYDVIFCGKQAVDHDNAAVGIQLAELMALPHVSLVGKLEISKDGKAFTAHRTVEGAVEVYEGTFPAVLTAQKGLNEPRYPSLPGIMKAKSKPMQKIDGGPLVPETTISIESLLLPPTRQAGTVLKEHEPKAAVEALIQYLQGNLKVL